jgi:hypothetical protein
MVERILGRYRQSEETRVVAATVTSKFVKKSEKPKAFGEEDKQK